MEFIYVQKCSYINYKKVHSYIIINREYDLTRSAFSNWVKKYNNTGSFKACDNRTEEEKELIRLKKENQQLRMENDILKQAALIFGRK